MLRLKERGGLKSVSRKNILYIIIEEEMIGTNENEMQREMGRERENVLCIRFII